MTSKALWIQSKPYDLGFFILSGLAALLLIVPYVVFREAAIWPIYSIYLVLFGLPHNYLTWATLLPGTSRHTFKMDAILSAAIVCVLICAMIPFTFGTSFGDWILSFIAYYSLWHAYRQHHGICKVYDSVQARRTGDTTIFADRKAMNLFFGLAANLILVWTFTHPHIEYLLSRESSHELIHPVVPWNFFLVYAAGTFVVGVYGLKRAVWDRYRQGKFIPWPQLGLMSVAILVYIVPYFFMGLDAIPIPVAIATIFHNVQYFGFVWAFERHRSKELETAQHVLGLPQRLALRNSWTTYGLLALVYSFSVIGIYFILPRAYGLAFIYFIGLAHYIIDGYVWRRDTNLLLPKVMDRWATKSA